MKRIRKRELLIKSREAMLAAVQIYNNPHITFKSESFITLAVIAWTYLLHAYYANRGIDYRYYKQKGERKYYDRTKHGAYKHWELERCLNEKASPLDSNTANNLRFLIGVRHEIEHQMTRQIDNSISAKIQACSINYNYYIKKLFGESLGVDQELGLSIQFSPIVPEQKDMLFNNDKVISNLNSFITSFEDSLTADEIGNTHYAYRVVFTRIDGKRKNTLTDEVISFIPADNPRAKGLNAEYTIIKETEKKKYTGNDIVLKMKEKGYSWFNVSMMTSYWKNDLGSRDSYGVYVTKHQWMWYDNWLPVIEKYCENEQKRREENDDLTLRPSAIVKLMKDAGYDRFNLWWLDTMTIQKGISREDTAYALKDKYGNTLWKREIIPIVKDFCEENRERLISNIQHVNWQEYHE